MAADYVSDSRAGGKWKRRIGYYSGYCLIVISALLVIGSYFPSINYIGIFGSVVLSLLPGWLVMIPIIAAMLVWGCGAGAPRVILVITAICTALAAVIIVFRVVGVARENGVQTSVGETLGFSDSLINNPPDELVRYTHDLGESLTVRIFRPKGRPPVGGWPVYMNIHGGGWVAGSNGDQSADMRWFADRGWIVVSVGYSLSGSTRHLSDRVTDQIGCAMAWTNANIRRRGGDPDRLALRGNSAGGNLAINVAYLANAGKLRSVCGGSVPRVQAVTPIYPGVDLDAIYHNDFALTGPWVRNMVVQYIGGAPAEFPQRYRWANSASHIAAGSPPTLVFVTPNDHLVPLKSMNTFVARARSAGVPIWTVTVPFAEHGFDAMGLGNAIVRQASLNFINKHIRSAGSRVPEPM